MRGSGRQFEEGQSGNPAGRPKGARNRTTLAMQALLEGEADALTRTLPHSNPRSAHSLTATPAGTLPPR